MPALFELAQRQRLPELMDDPALDERRHLQALRGLRRINWFGNSAGLIWPSLRELSRKLGRPIRVLDIATGSGDIPLALAHRAKKQGLSLEMAGCDLSRRAVEQAQRNAASADLPVEFFEHDVLHRPLPNGYDAIICSLFLHHLERDDAVELLRKMGEACGSLALVSDLVRTPSTYLMTYAASWLLTRSDVVHVDGPLSVRAAFNVAEARELASEGGIADCTIQRRFPCRFILTWWRKTQTDWRVFVRRSSQNGNSVTAGAINGGDLPVKRGFRSIARASR